MDSKALSFATIIPGQSYCFWMVLLLFLLQGPVFAAGKWFITPSLEFNETWSDNINLSPSGARKSAFVSEINPGIAVSRLGGRNNIDFNYRMQNIINQGGGGNVNVNHQLQLNSFSELSRNRLFLNARSTVSQQNIVNTGQLARDNLTNSSNRADVYTFSVNPQWTPRFNGYANGLFRLGYDFVDTTADQATTSNTYSGHAELSSGYKFNQMTWRMAYDHSLSRRDSTSVGGVSVDNDVTFRSYNAEVRYRFTRRYAVFAQAGYIDNTIPESTGTNQNGAFYTFGAAWTPSHRFTLQGAYGINQRFVSVLLAPTVRTSMSVRYQNSNVGTNTGDVWSASLNHRSARMVWTGRYFEDTTTIQQILLNQNVFNTPTTSGQQVANPAGNQPFSSNLGLASFTNEVLVRKRGELSVSGSTAKSDLNLTLFHSRRISQLTQNRDTSVGVSGFWAWRFLPRTTSTLSLSWNRNSNSSGLIPGASREDTLYTGALTITRNIADYFNISRGIFGSIEYRYFMQNSSDPGFSFQENRISASLAINF